MKFKIEKDIPIPKKSRKNKYPFADMEVGDSFIADDYTHKRMSSILGTAKSWARRHNKNADFLARNIDGKIRIWRYK